MSEKTNSRFDLPSLRFLWQREQDKGFPGRSVPVWRIPMNSWIPPLENWRADTLGDFPRLF